MRRAPRQRAVLVNSAVGLALLFGLLSLTGALRGLAANAAFSPSPVLELIVAPEELLVPQDGCDSYVNVPTADVNGPLVLDEQIAALPTEVRCFSYEFAEEVQSEGSLARWYCVFTARPAADCTEAFVEMSMPLDGCDPVFDAYERLIGRDCAVRDRELFRESYEEILSQASAGQRCGVLPDYEPLPPFDELWAVWSDPDSVGMAIGCEPPPTNCTTELGLPGWCTDTEPSPTPFPSPDPIDTVIDCFDEYPDAPCQVREYRRSTGELIRQYEIPRSDSPLQDAPASLNPAESSSP